MMRQEEKSSSRDQLEIVIDCMSLEEMEWSISVAKQEEFQGCMSVELAIIDMNTSRVPQSLVLQPLKEFRVSSHGKRCHLFNFISVGLRNLQASTLPTRHPSVTPTAH